MGRLCWSRVLESSFLSLHWSHAKPVWWQDLWPWRRPMLKSFVLKYCTPQKGPMWEQLLKNCSPWEGSHNGEVCRELSSLRGTSGRSRGLMWKVPPDEEGLSETMCDVGPQLPFPILLHCWGGRGRENCKWTCAQEERRVRGGTVFSFGCFSYLPWFDLQ